MCIRDSVHPPQLGGEAVRETVVTAHHHVRAGGPRRLTLIRNAPHEGEDCLTGTGGSTDEVNSRYGTPV